MKQKFILISVITLTLASLSGCHSKVGCPPLFKDAALQDSMQTYFDRIDSIPNAFGAPSLYVVSFLQSDQDSMIRFFAVSGLWEYIDVVDTTGLEFDEDPFDLLDEDDVNVPIDATMNQDADAHIDIPISREPNWIGLYRYGKKHILVEADWTPTEIINTSALEPYEDFVNLYHYDNPSQAHGCDLTFFFYNCEKQYSFKSPNTLRLVRRRIGKADPDYKDHPETIEY